ncbi:MAG: hypothetical protein ACRD2R_02150, partial [Terriglobales bacterium]
MLLLGFALPPAFAFQQAKGMEPSRRLVVPRVVLNFAEVAQREAAAPPPLVEQQAVPFLTIPEQPVPPEALAAAAAARGVVAPAALLPAPLVASPSPAATFLALDDSNTNIPPDTQGAVGTGYLMVTLNSQVRIQTRAGVELSKLTLASFWSGTTASGVFDPKVEYDPFNNRWLVSAVSDRRTAGSSVLIGASQTDDPRGLWNLYRVDADSTDMNWADYPSLGFNKDWVAVTVNVFANSDDAFVRADIYVFRKSQLFDGLALTTAVFT